MYVHTCACRVDNLQAWGFQSPWKVKWLHPSQPHWIVRYTYILTDVVHDSIRVWRKNRLQRKSPVWDFTKSKSQLWVNSKSIFKYFQRSYDRLANTFGGLDAVERAGDCPGTLLYPLFLLKVSDRRLRLTRSLCSTARPSDFPPKKNVKQKTWTDLESKWTLFRRIEAIWGTQFKPEWRTEHGVRGRFRAVSLIKKFKIEEDVSRNVPYVNSLTLPMRGGLWVKVSTRWFLWKWEAFFFWISGIQCEYYKGYFYRKY